MLNNQCLKKLNIAILYCTILFLCACHNGNTNNLELNEENEATEEAPGGWLKQNFDMTKDPALGYVPYERLAVAQQYTQNLMNARTLNTNALAWTERGPINVGGRTRAILVDKNDATGNTIFAGGVGGGIWKCTNFKSAAYSWSPINDTLPNLAITVLVQDPTTPNTMYAGTGEGWFNTDAIRGNGIYKSTDGGATWNQLASTKDNTDFQYVQDIVVANNGMLFAACRSAMYCNRGGVLKSLDGGATWTRVIGTYDGTGSCTGASNFRATDLEIAANGDLYAATGMMSDVAYNKGKIFRSDISNDDSIGNASRWVDITPPAIASSANWRRIEVATAPSNANVVYALCEKTGGTGSIGAIFRSNDKGTTWTQLANPSRCSLGSISSDFTNGQCWYDLIATVDPNNDSTCFIGGVEVYRTRDAGSTWLQVSQWANGCNLPYIHADIHNIVYPSNSSREMIVASDGGLSYSSDGGLTWTDKNNYYNITQFYACAMHPTNSNYFLAGAQDNGSHKFTTAGLNNTLKVTGGDGAYCHIDQTDGQIQVTSYVYNNYYYSRDGGSNFSTIPGGSSTTGQFINPTEYDDPLDVLYTSAASGTYGLVTGLNGTTNPVYQVVSVPEMVGKTITAFKLDPNVASGGTIWVTATNISSSTVIPQILKITNANTTTPTVTRNVTPAGFTAGSYISSIDVENGNPNHLLVTVSNYGAVSVLESTDGGTNWVNIEGNLPDMPVRWGIFAPANAALVSTTTGGGVILATEVGVWCTSVLNGTATTWAPQITGLPKVASYMLKYRVSDRTLAVATHGRGLFTTTLPSVATSVNTIINTKGFITYVSANLTNLFIKAGNLTNTKTMQIKVFDMQGRQLISKNTTYNNQMLPIQTLPSGAYVVKIFGDKKEQYVQQIVK